MVCRFSKLNVFISHLVPLAIVFLFYFTTLTAQNSATDSLKTVIANEKDDTTRFKAINQLVRITSQHNPDSAQMVLEQILPAAEATGNMDLFIDLNYSKGRIYMLRGQLDSAILIFEETKKLALDSGNKVAIADVLDQIGAAYLRLGKSDLAFQNMKEGLEVAVKSCPQETQFKAANNLGKSYSAMAKFDSAEIYLNQALDIQLEAGDIKEQARVLTNLATNTARQEGPSEKTLAYFDRALNLMKQTDFIVGVSIIYRDLGVTYYFDGDFPKALESMHNALRMVEGTTHYEAWIIGLDFLGEIYLSAEDYDNALLYWEKAATTWEEGFGNKKNSDFSFKRGKVMLLKKDYTGAQKLLLESLSIKNALGQFVSDDFYWNLGQVYEGLSQLDSALFYFGKAVELSTASKNFLVNSQSLTRLGKLAENRGSFTQALGYYQNAYGVATDNVLQENKMDAARGLYRIYKKQNNASEALRFLEIAQTIQDSIFNDKNTKEIARMQAGFEFEKEKQALEFAQQKELEQQTNIRRALWAALAVAGLIFFIGYRYYRSKQKANAELSKLNEEILNQKTIVEKQKEKLEELDKTKSRFFTNISHEFRTPLTIISGMIDQINEKPDLWLERGTKMIKQNTLGLLNLVNQILDLRKLESNELKVEMVQGDVVKYLRYISESHESYAASKGLQLHFLSVQEEIKMDYDPDKLLRIISNLLSNAIKYTPDSGNVYFHIDKKIKDRKPILSIRIEDTGAGIPEEDLPYIFDRFYQVDDSSTRKGEGTGIGLALTKELVKLLGGTIEAKSKVGKGTTFYMELPIKIESTIQVATQFEMDGDKTEIENSIIQPILFEPKIDQPIKEMGTAEKPNLLIVEDNPDVQQYLIACLEDEYQLSVADNGQIGIDMAVEQVPDLVISDVMMPEKDGFELTEKLKNDERTDHIPIILLTAKADVDSKINGLEKGADAYLAKPFEKKELMVRLEKLLELRKKLQTRYAIFSENGNTDKQLEDPFLQKLYALVEEEISNPELDMNKLCRSLGMSRSQVFRKLKAITGKSATAFIRSIRLQKGKQLLAKSNLTISEVAYEVGFTSLNYFSAAFLEEYGIRPSAVQK